jgi:hypothetical protein
MQQPPPQATPAFDMRSMRSQPEEQKQSVTAFTSQIAPNAKKRKLADTTLAPTHQIAGAAKRREKDISHLIEFLEALRGDKGAVTNKRKPKCRLQMRYPDEVKAFIVYLRYGSLDKEGEILRPMAQIRDMTGVRVSTCFSIVRAWRNKGFVISNGQIGVKRNRKLTDD